MTPVFFTKFSFRIRTRTGAVVDHLNIQGRDEGEAQRKLRQMYRDCEVLEARRLAVTGRAGASFEEVVDLLSG